MFTRAAVLSEEPRVTVLTSSSVSIYSGFRFCLPSVTGAEVEKLSCRRIEASGLLPRPLPQPSRSPQPPGTCECYSVTSLR